MVRRPRLDYPITGSLAAGIFPREFGQSADGKTLFVANYISSELEVIDLSRLKEATNPSRDVK